MAHSIADDQANPNHRRTVLLATDNKNSVIAEVVAGKTNHMAYSAYGHQSAQQEIMTSLGFNGELREARIGWYLLGSGYRAYNPRLMRFHSPDSWSPFGRGGLNPYTYCMGNPISNSDPTGRNAVTKFLSHTFNFFFSSSTGPNRSKSLKASNALGPMRPEKTGEFKGLAAIGTVVGGAPGPRGNNSPALQYVETRPKNHPGYVAGAASSGLTSRGNLQKASTANPNLKAGSGSSSSRRNSNTGSNRTESFSFNVDSPPDYSDLGGGIHSGPPSAATNRGPSGGSHLGLPLPDIPAPSSPSPSRWSGESGASDWSSSSSSSRSSSPPPPYVTLTDIRTGQSNSGWLTRRK